MRTSPTPTDRRKSIVGFNSSLVLNVLGVYLAFMLYLGFFFRKRVSSFADFILGNRGIPWFVIAMTMLAILIVGAITVFYFPTRRFPEHPTPVRQTRRALRRSRESPRQALLPSRYLP
jgi:hypothetical protein